MSLFPEETQEVSIPESTRILKIMRNQNKRAIEIRKQVLITNFENFWSSPEIAQAICDEEGTEASKWFTESWKEQLAIKELDKTWIFLTPPYPFTINEDGTVKITE